VKNEKAVKSGTTKPARPVVPSDWCERCNTHYFLILAGKDRGGSIQLCAPCWRECNGSRQ